QSPVDRQRRNVELVVLEEERHRALIEQVAVFDRIDTALQRAIDRAGRIGMSHHRNIGGPGLFYSRPDLLLGELGAVDAVGWRGNAAGSHTLDGGCPLADLLPARPPHSRPPVADAPESGAAYAVIEAPLACAADIGMTAGLG